MSDIGIILAVVLKMAWLWGSLLLVAIIVGLAQRADSQPTRITVDLPYRARTSEQAGPDHPDV